MAQSNRARPGRAGRKKSGGSRWGGERSGFCDGRADPETGGRRQSPVGTRGTVVRWSRCMGYPSGGSRFQCRHPQRMAWLNGSYHGGQWRPLRTFLQLTRSPWETHAIGVWQRGQRGAGGDGSAGSAAAPSAVAGSARFRSRSVRQRSR